MASKKDRFAAEYKKLEDEIIRDRVRDVFEKDADNYIEALSEIGFTWYDDKYPSEEDEENAAVPVNDRQQLLVSYFKGKVELSTTVLNALQAERKSEEPNYPLIRKYFRDANPHLKALILFGLKNDPTNLDILTDLVFFHEFERNLPELIEHLTRACQLEDDRQKFSEIAQEFHNSTQPDDYDALHALREIFDESSDKRKTIDFLINERNCQNQEEIVF